MTTPAGASGSEDVPLAEVSQVGLSEVMSIIALVASIATVLFGRDFGIAANAKLLAEAAVFLIPMATGFARAIKHHGVAHANALVTVAQIEAAARALIAAQQTAAPGAPTPDSATATTATATAAPTVAYGYDGDSAVVGKHVAGDIGADLPVTDLTGVAA